MSYLYHIRQCNTFTPEHYIPFKVGNELLGGMQKSFAQHLIQGNDVFYEDENTIYFNKVFDTAEQRTQACKPIIKSLHEKGIIDSWVNENYAVTQAFGEPPRFLIERAAVTYFGLRGYGVHLNGLVKKPDGIYVWVARRTKDKPFWPGKLDQMVAGGQPAGIGLMENLIKESAEEANIPESLARKAERVSEIHYRGETQRGLNVDTLFNYDLWLPDGFIPENTDGEVDEFMLMPIEELAEHTENTHHFKDNCNLVNIDLLIRLGVLSEQHSDYQAIIQGLYAPPTRLLL